MNDNYATNNSYPIREEPVKVVDAPQTVETWHEEENKDWKEQVTTPETVVSGPASPPDAVVSGPTTAPESVVSVPTTAPKAVESGPLTWLKGDEVDDLKSRWKVIQIEFVDEPRKSVEQADALVVEALDRIELVFKNQRTILNERWLNHEDVQTEDLRIALQSYRSFLNRILAL